MKKISLRQEIENIILSNDLEIHLGGNPRGDIDITLDKLELLFKKQKQELLNKVMIDHFKEAIKKLEHLE